MSLDIQCDKTGEKITEQGALRFIRTPEKTIKEHISKTYYENNIQSIIEEREEFKDFLEIFISPPNEHGEVKIFLKNKA